MQAPRSTNLVRTPGLLEPLHVVLELQAEHLAEKTAYRHLMDGETDEEVMSFAGLASQSKALALALEDYGCKGRPVLLVERPGLDFIGGLFACWHAGAIAVPVYPPGGTRHTERMRAVLADCGAQTAITSDPGISIPGVRTIAPGKHAGRCGDFVIREIDATLPCLLQYTSGSTASPKGVMISHHNLRAHFASLDVYRHLAISSAVSWLPPYHDMGLVIKILYAMEAGIPLTFFSPEQFVTKPVRWLRAISRFRGELSGAPNFAYETLVRSAQDCDLEGVDLSCWKAAVCGAERVRPETLDRFCRRFESFGFRRDAFLPGYGLAEATLTVTCVKSGAFPATCHHPVAGNLVSNGFPLPGIDLRIADPESGASLPGGGIGEVRIAGGVVAAGYWNRPLETAAAFGSEGCRDLRTGDLGFLHEGELYITGRIKDTIIIDGIKHSPEDIEARVMGRLPEISAAAAFASDSEGREGVVLAIEAPAVGKSDHAALCVSARSELADFIEIPVRNVLIVRAGLLPRTTSGKIRRSACREGFACGSLKVLHDDRCGEAKPGTGDSGILDILLECAGEIRGSGAARACDDIFSLGLGSLDATRLATRIRERTGIAVSNRDLLAATSFAELSHVLSERMPHTRGQFPTGEAMETRALTHAQERMWLLHQMAPDSVAYHVFGALEMKGLLSVSTLQRAMDTVVARHGMLSSRHGSHDGLPVVWFDRSIVPRLEVMDVPAGCSPDGLLIAFARRTFDLAAEPPFRACLVRISENHHLLAVCAHHIAADGWSIRLIAHEAASCYAAFLSDTTPQLPAIRTSYGSYAAGHRKWIESGAVDNQINYWKSRLAGHSGTLNLPVDFPRPAHSASAGGCAWRDLTNDMTERIAALGTRLRVTPFMIHLAAYLMLLRTHGAGDDLVVAIPVANRNHPDADGLVGTLVNTLPLRVTLQPGESLLSLILRVREASMYMQDHQDAPLEKIIEAVSPRRSADQSPLVQVMFDHQSIPLQTSWAEGLSCRPYPVHRGGAQFDLSLCLTEFGDTHRLHLEYRNDLFRHKTAEAMLDRLVRVLECVCDQTDIPVEDADVLTDADRRLLGSSTFGPVRPEFPLTCVTGLITRQVLDKPDRTAVSSGGSSMTYQELDRRSSQVAGLLGNAGIRRGDRVAVMLERNADLPAILLGVWKAGAAYVPLDAANPRERLRLILEDQGPVTVLLTRGLQDRLPGAESAILIDRSGIDAARPAEPEESAPEDTAYIIHTSGSTGRPKGVAIPHSALSNFLQSMAETPGFTSADRLLAVTTVSFDISLLEIFLPLVCGGSVEILSEHETRDGHALAKALETSGATVMQATPATWRMLIGAGWKGTGVLKVLCGGEALDSSLAGALAERAAQVWNLYGPTETTVWSTIWRVPPNPGPIRIGSPIANTGIHIVADDGRLPPPGVPGHLWISGAGLSQGYWNQPELTRARHAVIPTPDGGFVKAYQTGDIARLHDDGTLECLGRIDNQVKIRGFRVELGEIEAVLSSHPHVEMARAALRGFPPENARLVAWITPGDSRSTPSSSSLTEFLAASLPSHMIPAAIGVLQAFPLTSSGKVDLSALPTPDAEHVDLPSSDCPTMRKLIAIWMKLLERSSVHPDDNWFHIGGHSLLALRLFSEIHREFGCNPPLSAILEFPTPRLLAARIDPTPPPRDDS